MISAHTALQVVWPHALTPVQYCSSFSISKQCATKRERVYHNTFVCFRSKRQTRCEKQRRRCCTFFLLKVCNPWYCPKHPPPKQKCLKPCRLLFAWSKVGTGFHGTLSGNVYCSSKRILDDIRAFKGMEPAEADEDETGRDETATPQARRSSCVRSHQSCCVCCALYDESNESFRDRECPGEKRQIISRGRLSRPWRSTRL